jgi:hypothetical protein
VSKFAIKIEVWPYAFISDGKGAAGDQAMVGPRIRTFTVEASDFKDAYRCAQMIQTGIASHDRVWQASIRSIDERGPLA